MTPFTGDIIMFAGTYAIRNFAFCNGQLLNISSQATLFSLIGTISGGNGRTNFAIPEMRGRIPVHRNSGGGPGIPYPQGTLVGTDTVTLSESNLPVHNHEFQVSGNVTTTPSPDNTVVGKEVTYLPTTAMPFGSGHMYADMVADTGGTNPIENLAPYQAINFMIALAGAYPSRN